MKTLTSLSVLLSALALSLFASTAQAKKLDLDITTGTPVLSADAEQRAFIKVALTGYGIPERITKRAPVNVAIVLDRSGSMSGQKLTQAKDAAIAALQYLQGRDVISIISYDDSVRVEVPATRASDKASIRRAIRTIRAGGNTALFAGVSKGAREVNKFLEDNRVNRVILLSDGIANVGPSSPYELGSLGMSLARDGVSVTTIGLGLGYNEDLMFQLASRSDGNHVFAEQATDLAAIFADEFNDVTSVVAQDIDINIFCEEGVKPIRVLGRDAQIVGNRVRTRLNQVYSDQEKYVLLEVAVPAGTANSKRRLATVDVAYTDIIQNSAQNQNGDLWVRYSESQREIENAYDKKTLEAAFVQGANELSKEAVELRDQGLVERAKAKLQEAARYLQESSQSYDVSAPSVTAEVEAYEAQAAEVDDEADWNRNRKALRQKQYKVEKQQR